MKHSDQRAAHQSTIQQFNNSTTPFDAVLLIAFGGPNSMQDVRPFLANVLRGRPVPPQRIEDVVHHYERIGGRSPLTELTMRQAAALRALLEHEGPRLPVYVGMRNWDPYLRDTLAAMQREGARRAVGVILAAQHSDASWERYQRDVAAARAELGDGAPEIDFAPGWHDHPLFIEAVAAQARATLNALDAERRRAAQLIFTAHSIPTAMAADSAVRATAQRRSAAGRAATRLRRLHAGVPEPQRQPARALAGTRHRRGRARARRPHGVRDLLVVPLGFVCDHVEVLYDLDVEAEQAADQLRIGFLRAPTVNDHPSFIRMLAAVVGAHVRQ